MSESQSMSKKSQASLPGAEAHQDDLQLLVLQQADQIASLQAMVAKLSEQFAASRTQYATPNPGILTDYDMLSRNQAVKNRQEREFREREDARQRIEDALLDGPHKFKVSFEREPMMDRVVGVRNSGQLGIIEAESKYKHYFGIIAWESWKKFSVEEVSPSETVSV